MKVTKDSGYYMMHYTYTFLLWEDSALRRHAPGIAGVDVYKNNIVYMYIPTGGMRLL